VVVGERFWRQHLAADPGVVGSPLRVNGHVFTLIGVAAAGFSGTFTGFDIQMWVPLAAQPFAMPETMDRIDRRDAAFLMLTGRLRGDRTPRAVAAELAPVAEQLKQLAPASHRGFGVAVVPATGVHPFIQSLLPMFLALLSAAVFILLAIACANVAGLLMARAVERRREMATRAALGASRWRLARQLLGEASFLAGVGGALGLLLSFWTVSALRAWRPSATVPLVLPVAMDLRVAAFALSVTALTALLFGAAPALQGSRFDLAAAMKHDVTSARRQRGRRALVAVQLVLSLVLLLPSALLVRGLANAHAVQLGFNPDRVYTIALEPRLAGLGEARTRRFHEDLQRRLTEVPGVSATSFALFIPLGDRGDALPIRPGANKEQAAQSIPYNAVTPGYLEMLDVPLLRGRAFTPGDGADSPWVAVVNQAFASRMWPAQDPIGQVFRIGDEPRLREVVGVVADGKYGSYADNHRPFVYLVYSQFYRADMVLHVKLASPSVDALKLVHQAVVGMNPDVPAAAPAPMTEGMAWALVPVRVAAAVLGTAGAVALGLALIGLYALLSYGVAQRTREIGIRVALGATARDIRRLIAADVRCLAVSAVLIGTALAIAAARLMRALLVGIGPADPVAIAGALVLLILVIWIALRLPTRRALRVEPSVALRADP
jgi:predicted permease